MYANENVTHFLHVHIQGAPHVEYHLLKSLFLMA